MEGSENSSEIKVFQELGYDQSNDKKIEHYITQISQCSKEMGEVNDSSLDWLAKELFRDDSNSNNLSCNNKQVANSSASMINKSLLSGGVGGAVGDLPAYSGLVDFIDKTLTLSNQNIVRGLLGSLKTQWNNGKYSTTFHDILEGFKYDWHLLTEQLKGVKNIIGKSIMLESKTNYISIFIWIIDIIVWQNVKIYFFIYLIVIIVSFLAIKRQTKFKEKIL